jgi:hypothetical protein
LRSIVQTVSCPIFLHDDIKAPVEAIFHTPMRPGDRIEALGKRSAASGCGLSPGGHRAVAMARVG